MDTAVQTALEKASQDEATLVLAFLGHAYSDGEDLYLLPYDGSCEESGPIRGYALVCSSVGYSRTIPSLTACWCCSMPAMRVVLSSTHRTVGYKA